MIIERTVAEMMDRQAQIAAQIITHLAEHEIHAERYSDGIRVIHPEHRTVYYQLVEFQLKQARREEDYWQMQDTGQVVVKVSRRKLPSSYRETSSRFTEKKDCTFNPNMMRAVLGSARTEWARIIKEMGTDAAKKSAISSLNESAPSGKIVDTSWRGPLSGASIRQDDGSFAPAVHISTPIPLTETTRDLLVSLFDLYPDTFYQDRDEEQLDK